MKITGCSAVILGAVVGMLGAAGTISANTGKSLANTINAPVPVDSHRVPATVAKASAAANAKAKSRAIASFLKIPLSFEQNEGQTNSHFKFLSRGPGYELFLSPTSAFLGLSKPAQRTAPTPGHSLKQGKTADAMVRVDLIGANPNAQIEGRDKLAGKVNYLTGRDSSKWHTNIPTFGRVSYRNVYPGVDLAYHGGNQRQLEYDFIVAPGADLKAIELGFAGAKKLSLDKKGNLVLQLANGKLIEHAPVVYQDTEGKRQRVSGRFVMHGKGRVGFAVASYDRSKPLVIDPVLEYSTFLGGEAYDFGWSIATDASGDAFVTGETSSYSFPVTQGALETCLGYSYFDDTCYGADKSAFVSKLNPTGTALIYSTYLGGSYFYSEDDGYSEGYGIAIDSLGDAYVTGITEDYDFPVTYPDSFQFCLGGFNGMDCNGADGNAFVTELTPDGSALVYSTYLGGTTYDYGSGIAVDAAGDAFVTGGTYSDDFPVTMGAFQTTLNGYENAFVTELDPTGTLQIYSSYLGGSGGPGIGDWANGIAINTSGNAYVTGNAYSYDFPVTPGAFQTCAGGPESCNDVYAFNGFVTEFSADGSNLIYSTYLGGGFDDWGNAVAVDPSGNAYVTGLAASENFPVTENAFIPYPDFDCSAAFLTELNPTGSAEIYSTYLYGGYEEDCSYDGGNPLDFYFTQFGSSVALDGANDVYIGGRTDSYEFPATSNDQCYCQGYPYTCCTGYGTGTCSTIQEYFGGDNDGFLTEFAVSPPGSYAPLNVAMSTFLGGEYYDGVFGVALDPSGSVYLTGDSASVDFPTTASAFQTGLDGRQNAFVAKIGCLPKGTAQIFAGNSYDPNNGSTIQIFGNQSNCDSSPQSFLYGDKTGLNYPFGLAYSTIAGSIESTPPFLYVVNYGGASVSYFSHYKYSEAQWSGDGNHHPDGTISGPDTGLAGAMGIAVDNSTGNVYVANSAGGSDFSGSITVYTNAQIASIPFAGSADLVPVAVIAGTNTGLNSPLGVAVDPATGNIYVANNAGPNGTGGDGSVTEYSLAQITAIIGGANGNVTPVETIFGPLTGLSQPSAIAIDGDSNVYVANNSGDAIGPLASGSITIYSQGAITGGLSNAGFLFPNSDAIPNATIIGPPSGPNYTLLNDAVGLAVDANGLIYVSNFGQTGSVTVYPSLTNLGSQANYPNVAPVANITGPDTGLYGPRGLAVDPPPARTRRQRRRKKHRH